jgi:hypothetical protein
MAFHNLIQSLLAQGGKLGAPLAQFGVRWQAQRDTAFLDETESAVVAALCRRTPCVVLCIELESE